MPGHDVRERPLRREADDDRHDRGRRERRARVVPRRLELPQHDSRRRATTPDAPRPRRSRRPRARTPRRAGHPAGAARCDPRLMPPAGAHDQSRAPSDSPPPIVAGPRAGRRLHSGSAPPLRSLARCARAGPLRTPRGGLRSQARAHLREARHDLPRERARRHERIITVEAPPRLVLVVTGGPQRMLARSGCARPSHRPMSRPRASRRRIPTSWSSGRAHCRGRAANEHFIRQADGARVRDARRPARGHRARRRRPRRAHEPRGGRAARSRSRCAGSARTSPSRLAGVAPVTVYVDAGFGASIQRTTLLARLLTSPARISSGPPTASRRSTPACCTSSIPTPTSRRARAASRSPGCAPSPAAHAAGRRRRPLLRRRRRRRARGHDRLRAPALARALAASDVIKQ